MFRHVLRRLLHPFGRHCILAFALFAVSAHQSIAYNGCQSKASASTATAVVNVPAPPAPSSNATAIINMPAPTFAAPAPSAGLFIPAPLAAESTTTTTTTTTTTGGTAMAVAQPATMGVVGVNALAVHLGPLQRIRIAHEQEVAARRQANAVLLTQNQVASTSAIAVASTGQVAVAAPRRRLFGCR